MKENGIVTKILSDAEQRALAAVAEAEARADKTVGEAREAAEKYREDQLSLLSARHAEVIRRTEINGRLEANKLMLAAKRRALDSVYEGALRILCALSEKEYVDFIGSLIESYADGGETVVLAEACAFKEKIAALEVIAKKGLLIAKEGGNFSGGLILIGGGCDKNLTFEALLESARDQSQAEVAEKLFG
ncbi:MAG: hypothetical protein J6126_02465 [Clostridia bacterium]|nr:hypothetical protein [Clostridia bacterium]